MSRLMRNSSLLIPFSYALFGALWVLTTDYLVLIYLDDPERIRLWQTYKGEVFVAVSTLFIYGLLARTAAWRRRAQKKLTEQEELYRLLFENNPLPMWVYDLETLKFLAVNEAAIVKYGYSRAEFLTMRLQDIRPVQDVSHLLQDVAETTQRLNFAREWRHQNKNGLVFLVEIASHALTYNGRAARLVVANDVTERKEAEIALRASEKRFRTAIEEAPFPIIMHADDGEVLALSQAWTDLSGYSKVDIPTLDEWISKAYGEEAQYVWSEISKVYDGTGPISGGKYHITCKNGSQRIWEFSTTPLGSLPDGRRHAVSMAVDVTTDEATREALRQKAEQVTQIMYSVPDGVLLLSPTYRVLQANPRAAQYLAVLAEAKVGDTLTHLANRPLSRLLTSPLPGKWHEVERNDRVFEIIARSLESTPVLEGWVLVLRDVTKQRSVQKQLQRQERLAAVGQLAAGIAHDFNNIMAVIVLYTQLAEQSQDKPEVQRKQLKTVNIQANRAARLIEQILDFSRRAVLERRPTDLLPLLKEEMKLLHRTLPENIEIELNYEPGEYLVQADPTRIQQTVMNLALNARDAMPEGGELRFNLGQLNISDSKSSPLPTMVPGDWIRLTVTDTGHGIAPETLDHIFEPFFTTKEPGEGTGLGLAQVHGIVGQHGGHISVQSRQGGETTFTIYLPLLTVSSELDTEGEEARWPQGEGKMILVVEDDVSLRTALVATLEAWGYQVLEGANGQEALALLSQYQEIVDLVVSDVIMPYMGGRALLHTMRQRGWQMPVILLTGHPLGTDLEALHAEGAMALLSKPVDPADLAQAITTTLTDEEE